jgi:hypothetical protein
MAAVARLENYKKDQVRLSSAQPVFQSGMSAFEKAATMLDSSCNAAESALLWCHVTLQ